MIPVTRTFMPSMKDYQQRLNQIWESGQLTNNGALVHELSQELKNYLQVGRIELLSNGTLALQLAIKALDLKGEIITTPYSYVATTNSIIWEGCDPIFVDIDSRSFCIDPDLIEAAITEKTTAILATHVYGFPCDVDKIQAVADRHGLKVIYDAAHAFGVRLHGRSILEYGDCSTLSFHATKLFHTGEGGAVICKGVDVAQRLSLMSKFGHIGEDNYVDVGINAKMSELHAAMGLSVLPKVVDIIEARRQCSAWYDELLADAVLQRPAVVAGLEYNFAYYPVVFETHEIMMQVRQVLHDHGIAPRRYFYPSLNNLPFLRADLRAPCPVSESLASRVLCLPLFVELSKESVTNICNLILGIINPRSLKL
jgi:dTDP-4-amino-4,6-dideoxygalactose transaminase